MPLVLSPSKGGPTPPPPAPPPPPPRARAGEVRGAAPGVVPAGGRLQVRDGGPHAAHGGGYRARFVRCGHGVISNCHAEPSGVEGRWVEGVSIWRWLVRERGRGAPPKIPSRPWCCPDRAGAPLRMTVGAAAISRDS